MLSTLTTTTAATATTTLTTLLKPTTNRTALIKSQSLRDLRANDLVLLERRGDVIPAVVGRIANMTPQEIDILRLEGVADERLLDPNSYSDPSQPLIYDTLEKDDDDRLVCPCMRKSVLQRQINNDATESSSYFCTAGNCESQSLKKLEHYATKKAMNIDGISTKILEMLYEAGLINGKCYLPRSFYD